MLNDKRKSSVVVGDVDGVQLEEGEDLDENVPQALTRVFPFRSLNAATQLREQLENRARR